MNTLERIKLSDELDHTLWAVYKAWEREPDDTFSAHGYAMFNKIVGYAFWDCEWFLEQANG